MPNEKIIRGKMKRNLKQIVTISQFSMKNKMYTMILPDFYCTNQVMYENDW